MARRRPWYSVRSIKHSADAIFTKAAEARGMRLIAGKVLMDKPTARKHCAMTAETGYADSKAN